jgi:predicted nucleotide-binding protein
MALAPHTVLLISREDAEQRMRQRIDLAKTVLPGDRWSSDELHAGEERERAWRVYNRELLLRIFSTDEFAREYNLAAVPIHQTGDRYFDVDSNTIAGRVFGSLRKQVARLESIIDRLELIDEGTVEGPSPLDKSKVFVVHGHDDGAKEGVARFLEKLDLKAIILQEQPNRGRTIIEKFVDYAREVGFAVVLLTPDDLRGGATDESQTARARQNVIFELGYFVGSLGRGRACLLRKGEVEIPSDLYGVVYTHMDSASAWKIELARELKDAGFEFDASKVLA